MGLRKHIKALQRYLQAKLWTTAGGHAALIVGFVLGWFYYWFAVANRYVVFLYHHLNATPFDRVTRGRYWMAGLVASGMVAVLYTGGQWGLGRIAAWRRRTYNPPAWWRVWMLCLPALIISIPIITMTANAPTLPPWLAGACIVATSAGLALALLPGAMAATRPKALAWLLLDGAGLVPVLLILRALELPRLGLRMPFGEGVLFILVGASVLGSAAWLAIVTGLRAWQGQPCCPSTGALLAAGAGLSYLLLPLLHYGLNGYGYISAASNFFAQDVGLQVTTWTIALVLAMSTSWAREAIREGHADKKLTQGREGAETHKFDVILENHLPGSYRKSPPS